MNGSSGGSGGGGAGGGGGYNIPVSLSDATAQAFANQFQAGTTFNFDSPYSGTNYAAQSANPTLPTTATSAAAEGDALASTSGSGVVLAASPAGVSVNWKMIAAIAGAVVALAGVAYYLRHKS